MKNLIAHLLNILDDISKHIPIPKALTSYTIVQWDLNSTNFKVDFLSLCSADLIYEYIMLRNNLNSNGCWSLQETKLIYIVVNDIWFILICHYSNRSDPGFKFIVFILLPPSPFSLLNGIRISILFSLSLTICSTVSFVLFSILCTWCFSIHFLVFVLIFFCILLSYWFLE